MQQLNRKLLWESESSLSSADELPIHLYRILIYMLSVLPLVGFILLKFLDVGVWNFMFAYSALTFFIFILNNNFGVPKYLKFLFFITIYRISIDILMVGKDLNIKYFYQNDIILTFLLLFLIENISINRRDFKKLLQISEFVIYFAFIVIIIQQLVSPTFMLKPDRFAGILHMKSWDMRLPSIYTWAGDLSALGLAFFPIVAILIADKIKNKKNYIFLCTIGGFVAFLSRSRFIMLNYFLIFALLFVYKKIQRRILISIISIIFILFSSVFIMNKIGVDVNKMLNERILEKSAGGIMQGSASTRILAFQIFAKLFPEHPLLGVGYRTVSKKLIYETGGMTSQIHVGYLSILYYYGLVGGMLYFLFIYYLGKRLYFSAKWTNEWGPFIGFMMYPLAELTVVYMNLLHMGTLMTIVAYRYYHEEKMNCPRKITSTSSDKNI